MIQGPDKAAWVTDSGLGAIVRVGWPECSVCVFALPAGAPCARPRQQDLACLAIAGRRGEVWLPESDTEHLSVIRTA